MQNVMMAFISHLYFSILDPLNLDNDHSQIDTSLKRVYYPINHQLT